jgi:hypothetical protein
LHEIFPLVLGLDALAGDLSDPLVHFFLIVEPEFRVEEVFDYFVDVQVGVFDSIHFLQDVELLGFEGHIEMLSFFLEAFLGKGSVF